jgi:hypothetical protein
MNTKLLFKLDEPRRWKKNMLAISWERCCCNKFAKPMLQTSKELQNKIPTFFFKLNNTKSDP